MAKGFKTGGIQKGGRYKHAVNRDMEAYKPDTSSTAIPCSGGVYAIVDDSDLPIVKGYTWSLKSDKGSNLRYAQSGHKGTTISMHRLVTAAPAGMVVDHIDGNGLNNRQSNLRIATNRQNSYNRGASPRGKWGLKGVTFRRDVGKFLATILSPSFKIGYYRTTLQASLAREVVERAVAGEFSRGPMHFLDDETLGILIDLFEVKYRMPPEERLGPGLSQPQAKDYAISS